jgi:mannose-6-phosphate isomerase
LNRRRRRRYSFPHEREPDVNAIEGLCPLQFAPVYKDYIWGGDRIVRKYRRAAPPGIYAESWEVSTRPEGMSVVAGGPHAGRTLEDLVRAWGAALLGTRAPAGRFPLLIKLIDSRERLSVQVHPDDEAARRYGGEAKTEMWYVLDAERGAGVFAGLKPGVDAKAFGEAMQTKRVEELLTRIPVTKGDAVFIPGGLVHTIDAGCLLLEIQQNSNTTYRIYDWDRVGADGKPRPLHLKQALQAIRWDVSSSPKIQPRELGDCGGNQFWEVLRCPYFRLERISLSERMPFGGDGSRFAVLFVASGRVLIESGGAGETLVPGSSCLVPAALTSCVLKPLEGSADILRVTVP